MKRSSLEEYLGKKVKVRIFDGDIYEGVLHKTGEKEYKHEPNLYIPRNYYFLTNESGKLTCALFKCSHVKKIKELLWTI